MEVKYFRISNKGPRMMSYFSSKNILYYGFTKWAAAFFCPVNQRKDSSLLSTRRGAGSRSLHLILTRAVWAGCECGHVSAEEAVSGRLSALTGVVPTANHRAGIPTLPHALLRNRFIVPWKAREIRLFPHISRFLINLPILCFSASSLWLGYRVNMSPNSKSAAASKSCVVCCFKNCQSNQRSFV